MSMRYGTLVICQACGIHDECRWSDAVNDSMISKRLCYSCMFWDGQVERQANNDQTLLVVGGVLYDYVVLDRHANSYHQLLAILGAEEKWYEIAFTDGRVAHTTNVIRHATIPTAWRDKLRNNATMKPMVATPRRVVS
jgi:hypothetical protein